MTAPQRRSDEAAKTDAAVLTSQRAEITAERWNATPKSGSAHTALLPHGLTANDESGYGVLRVALKLSSRDFFQRCAPALSEMETTERLNGGEHPDVTQIYVCLYFCCVHM